MVAIAGMSMAIMETLTVNLDGELCDEEVHPESDRASRLVAQNPVP